MPERFLQYQLFGDGYKKEYGYPPGTGGFRGPICTVCGHSMRCILKTPAIVPQSVGQPDYYNNKKSILKKHSPGFLLPAFFYARHNRIEILIKPLFALFGIIPAPVAITLDEPDRIGRSRFFTSTLNPLILISFNVLTSIHRHLHQPRSI